MNWQAILTLAGPHTGAELADQVHESELDSFGAVTGVDDLGRARIVITVPADTLAQAAAIARTVLAASGFTEGIRLDVMTTEEYDRLWLGPEPKSPRPG